MLHLGRPDQDRTYTAIGRVLVNFVKQRPRVHSSMKVAIQMGRGGEGV